MYGTIVLTCNTCKDVHIELPKPVDGEHLFHKVKVSQFYCPHCLVCCV